MFFGLLLGRNDCKSPTEILAFCSSSGTLSKSPMLVAKLEGIKELLLADDLSDDIAEKDCPHLRGALRSCFKEKKANISKLPYFHTCPRVRRSGGGPKIFPGGVSFSSPWGGGSQNVSLGGGGDGGDNFL